MDTHTSSIRERTAVKIVNMINHPANTAAHEDKIEQLIREFQAKHDPKEELPLMSFLLQARFVRNNPMPKRLW